MRRQKGEAKKIMSKKLLKNLCTVFLAWFMALLLSPQSAQAQEKEAYVVKSSDNKTLTFYYDDQKSSRTGSNVWGIEETRIGDYGKTYPAWSGMGDTPESEVTIAVFDASFKNYLPQSTKFWFLNLKKLEEIEGLTNLNTSEVTTMMGMFDGCKSLTSLDLSNFNTENVQDMRGMFDGCKSLTSLNLSNFKTENVQDMSLMFSGCQNLTSLNLSNFKTENVQNMVGMFAGCDNLTSLDLSNFNTENVQNMGYMFWICQNLTSLDLSNFNTENVQYMSYMFRGCQNLTSLNLSNFNTENVQYMREMFSECNSLQTIYCNNTWTCSKSWEMFFSCTKLQGAVPYDASKTDVSMANPNTGYFTKKESTGVATATTEANANIQAIYSTDGRRLNELQRGLNIVRMSNGTTQKILRK